MKHIPYWLENLENEDYEFIRKFIICSGSLKDLAQDYNVSYPTMRIRLDKLIKKIEINKQINDSYISLIKKLALDEKFDFDTAKVLIDEYRKENNK